MHMTIENVGVGSTLLEWEITFSILAKGMHMSVHGLHRKDLIGDDFCIVYCAYLYFTSQ